jgi:iron complex transport system substrate-binding protein
MKLLRFCSIAAVIGTITLTACSSSSTTASPSANTYTDDIGRTVTIQNIPQRIVSLSPSNTEIVYALGLQDELVGVTSDDDYPADAQTKPIVSDYSTTDLEKVVNAKPDLVLADSIQQHDVIPALENLGITVYVMTPPDMNGIYRDIQVLGRITGKTKDAAALVASMQSSIKSVTDKTNKLSDAQKPRVLYVTWYDPIWTAGSGTMIQYLIDQAGGTNIAAGLSGYATISLEDVVQQNPQVIIVMSSMGSMGSSDASLNYVETNDQLKSTDAVKNGRVYEVDSDIFARTTPRIVDGLQILAQYVNPELFK